MSAHAPPDRQERANRSVWARGRFVRKYAHRQLRPVEADLLLRHHATLSGRVLEIGCGAGRLTGYLTVISDAVHGIDIASAMVEHCRSAYPGATFSVTDLRDLSRFGDASFDAVVAGFNVIDVLSDAERRRALQDLHRVLDRDGILIMSSHNRNHLPQVRGPGQLRLADPRTLAHDVLHLPVALRNHRRMVPLERREHDYALVNDSAHDYALVHYYISPRAQEEQLATAGFDLLECLDIQGAPVGADGAPHCPELHYAARRSA